MIQQPLTHGVNMLFHCRGLAPFIAYWPGLTHSIQTKVSPRVSVSWTQSNFVQSNPGCWTHNQVWFVHTTLPGELWHLRSQWFERELAAQDAADLDLASCNQCGSSAHRGSSHTLVGRIYSVIKGKSSFLHMAHQPVARPWTSSHLFRQWVIPAVLVAKYECCLMDSYFLGTV